MSQVYARARSDSEFKESVKSARPDISGAETRHFLKGRVEASGSRNDDDGSSQAAK